MAAAAEKQANVFEINQLFLYTRLKHTTVHYCIAFEIKTSITLVSPFRVHTAQIFAL